jgi:hypothetical protein
MRARVRGQQLRVVDAGRLVCICGSLSPEFLLPGCKPTKHPAS